MQHYLLSVLLFLLGGNCVAQDKTSDEANFHWIQAYSGGSLPGVAGGVSVNLNFGKLLYKLSVHRYESEFLVFFSPPPETLTTINIQGGYVIKIGHGLFTFSGGLGYGEYNDPLRVGETGGWFSSGIYEDRRVGQFVLPLEAQASLVVLEIMNLSVVAGAQLSADASHAYLGLGIGFGKFF